MNCDSATTKDKRSTDRKLSFWLFIFFFILLAYIHQIRFDFGTPNSRLDLLHAIVVQRTLRIDAYETNTVDKALYGGHFYSPKPPGSAALALPAFALTTALLRHYGVELASNPASLMTSWAACVFSQALPAALGAM